MVTNSCQGKSPAVFFFEPIHPDGLYIGAGPVFCSEKLPVIGQTQNLIAVGIPSSQITASPDKCGSGSSQFTEFTGYCDNLILLQFECFYETECVSAMMARLPSEIAQVGIVIIAAVLHIEFESMFRNHVP